MAVTIIGIVTLILLLEVVNTIVRKEKNLSKNEMVFLLLIIIASVFAAIILAFARK